MTTQRNILRAKTVDGMAAMAVRGARTLTFALLAVLVAAPSAVAGGGQEQTHLTAAGQAAAKAAVMTRDDLNAPAGWTGGPQKPDLTPAAPCSGFDPKQSDLVRTGAAQSIFTDSGGISFDSEAQVLRSAEMLGKDWRRTVLAPQVPGCLRERMIKQIRASKRVYVDFGRVAFPHVTTRTAAFRVIYDERVGKTTVRRFTDLVFIGTKRTEIFIGTTAPLSAVSFVFPAEVRLAGRLVQRSRA
jgi:hypothetical protein